MTETESPRRLLGLALLVVSLLLLGIAAGTAVLAMSNTTRLSDRVEASGALARANVRTLTQTERELLQLQLLLVANSSDRNEIALQKALVTQRTRESSVEFQVLTATT